MDANEVLAYLRQTPGNTNPNYVKSLLSNTAELFDANFVGTPDPEDPGVFSKITWTCDKSYDELMAAHNAGKLVRMRYTLKGMNADAWLLQTGTTDTVFSSIGLGIYNNQIMYIQAIVSSSNEAEGIILPLKIDLD